MEKMIWPVAILTMVCAAGCTTQPRDLSLGQEESFDGLRQVKNTVAHRVWVREGLDLSGYDALMLQGAGIKYRMVNSAGTVRARSSQTEFPITPRAKERLVEIARESFTAELKRSERFRFTDSAGSSTLLVEAALIDVVSFVPPEPSGRGDTFLSRIGEATLVVQISDSQTGAALARIVDRRAAQPTVAQRSSTPLNQSEVRRLMQRWARQLREGLDRLQEEIID
jgi:hypothetical protein